MSQCFPPFSSVEVDVLPLALPLALPLTLSLTLSLSLSYEDPTRSAPASPAPFGVVSSAELRTP
jgi:hypothetical protein